MPCQIGEDCFLKYICNRIAGCLFLACNAIASEFWDKENQSNSSNARFFSSNHATRYISQRQWDASANIYSSPTAYMSKDLVWAIQPKTHKLFFCVLNPDARISLPNKWEIGQIHPLTSIFTEYLTPDLKKNFDVSSNTLSFKPNSKYLTGQGFSAILKDKGQ